MWEINDKYGFNSETSKNKGQIDIDQELGEMIYNLSSDPTNKILVDIGTWNGLGSTKCFIEGMKQNTESKLITIENNDEKVEIAKSHLSRIISEHGLQVEFLNGTLVENFEVENWISENSIILNEDQKYWLSIDKINSNNKVYIDYPSIDVLLVDGSEFTGFLEVKLLMSRSKFILLDDVNTMKNKMSREYLLSDENFELIKENLETRNGYSVFKNKNYNL